MRKLYDRKWKTWKGTRKCTKSTIVRMMGYKKNRNRQKYCNWCNENKSRDMFEDNGVCFACFWKYFVKGENDNAICGF